MLTQVLKNWWCKYSVLLESVQIVAAQYRTYWLFIQGISVPQCWDYRLRKEGFYDLCGLILKPHRTFGSCHVYLGELSTSQKLLRKGTGHRSDQRLQKPGQEKWSCLRWCNEWAILLEPFSNHVWYFISSCWANTTLKRTCLCTSVS